MNSIELEVLIPGYNRPSIEAAIESVLKQATDPKVRGRVAVHACDDAGDHYNLLDHARDEWSDYENLTISRNVVNLGMSNNLKTMVCSSKAKYVLILTDDDTLEDDAISRCLHLITILDGTAAFLFPRNGWDDDENLRVKDCVVSARSEKWIGQNPVHSMRYARHGFILSGLLLRRTAIDLSAWYQVEENAYFPVYILAKILESERILYSNFSIVRHRVFNKTFWHRWGDNQITIARRLYSDFACVLMLISEDATKGRRSWVKLMCQYYLFWNLLRQRLSWSLLQPSEFSPPSIEGRDRAVLLAFRFGERLLVRFWGPLLALNHTRVACRQLISRKCT